MLSPYSPLGSVLPLLRQLRIVDRCRHPAHCLLMAVVVPPRALVHDLAVLLAQQVLRMLIEAQSQVVGPCPLLDQRSSCPWRV